MTGALMLPTSITRLQNGDSSRTVLAMKAGGVATIPSTGLARLPLTACRPASSRDAQIRSKTDSVSASANAVALFSIPTTEVSASGNCSRNARATDVPSKPQPAITSVFVRSRTSISAGSAKLYRARCSVMRHYSRIALG